MLNQDIIREATRLTRAGQLVEATALLQRMLHGERAANAPPRSHGHIALPRSDHHRRKGQCGRGAGEFSAIRTSPRSAAARIHPRTSKGRPAIGMRGVMKRAPLTSPDIVPEGARFIEGTYGSPAGSRAYKLFIPSGYREQPLPLIVMLHGCTQSPDDFAVGTRMNLLAEKHNCFVVYPARRARPTRPNAGTGFARRTSSEAEANLR